MSLTMKDSEFEGLLDKIVSDAALETDWVDLLSQLEYVGCRKILKGVPYDEMNVQTLQHVSEEALHALLLRRVVEARIPRRSWKDNPFADIGFAYFQQLDEQISRRERLSYGLVSWVIEQRVLWLYPLYEFKTSDIGVKRVLNQILLQERRHAEFFDNIATSSIREALLEIEAGLWKSLVTRMNERVRERYLS